MISTDLVTGRWKNSKSTTKGIDEFILHDDNGKLSIEFRGVNGGFLPTKLGPMMAVGHATDEGSSDCIAFQAEGNHDGKSFFFAGNVNKGLIIIATYVKVSSESKSNFFVREFFYKLK